MANQIEIAEDVILAYNAAMDRYDFDLADQLLHQHGEGLAQHRATWRPFRYWDQANGPNPFLMNYELPPFNSAQIDAIQDYTDEAYLDLNEKLREGKKMDRRHQSVHEGLSSIFNQLSTHEPVTAYRTITIPDKQARSQLISNFKPGNVFKNSGYTSTMVHGDVDLNHPAVVKPLMSRPDSFDNSDQVVYKIHANFGLDMKPYSWVPAEHEYLMPHRETFRVLDYTPPSEDKFGRHVVELDQLR